MHDYLLEKFAVKLRHACEALGLTEQYERGELEAMDFEGRGGALKLGIQKDRTGQFPDRNSVLDYIRPKDKAKADTGPALVDDEVPW